LSSPLSSLPHTHPYLLFALFFPSFLFLELVAALLVYTTYVLQPPSPIPESTKNGESGYTTEATLKTEDVSATGSEDVKPLLSPEFGQSTTESGSETISSGTEGVLDEEREAAEAARARRLRLGKGGVGMSEVAGDGGEETFVDDEEAGASVSDIEAEIDEVVGGAVKEEDFDDTATIGGVRSFSPPRLPPTFLHFACLRSCRAASAPRLAVLTCPLYLQSESTRRTTSTFGPSLAGTSASSATAASRLSTGLRERTFAEERDEE
jgi:hypothetical protein